MPDRLALTLFETSQYITSNAHSKSGSKKNSWCRTRILNTLSLDASELAILVPTMLASRACPSVCPVQWFSYGNYYQDIDGPIIAKCGANSKEKLRAVSWLRRLDAGLSPRRGGFDPRSVHVGFVVDKLALVQVSPTEYFGFPLSISFHRCSITRKNGKKTLFIFITGLHNKSQGCGASVASAEGPFTKIKEKLTFFNSYPPHSVTSPFSPIVTTWPTHRSLLHLTKWLGPFPSPMVKRFVCNKLKYVWHLKQVYCPQICLE